MDANIVEWTDEYAPSPDNPHDPSCDCADCCAIAEKEYFEEHEDWDARYGHHPDCQCNACYYGYDLAKWAFHASEY